MQGKNETLSTKNNLELYPEIKAFDEQWLNVGTLHQIYFARYGNPQGIPVIVLHGGPGAGTAPFYAQYFDPNKYHIILSDQRGAGRSKPQGEMQENTTHDLVEDIELIREHLGIEQWVSFGGSWGSTLALVYAETHPERVSGLILRGIFLGRPQDLNYFAQPNGTSEYFRSNEWKEFKQKTQSLAERAGLKDVSFETGKQYNMYHLYYDILKSTTDEELKLDAAAAIYEWETHNAFLIPPPKKSVRDPNDVIAGITETTYFKHNCFLRPNQILEDIEKIRGIPVHIVQGMYDLICPPLMANDLENALREINPDNQQIIVRHDCLAGHSMREVEIRKSLIEAQAHLACLQELKPKAYVKYDSTSSRLFTTVAKAKPVVTEMKENHDKATQSDNLESMQSDMELS